MKVSVLICCYNSARRLPETLKHLANQQVPEDFQWEIVLVDNNCSDNTAEKAKELWVKYGSSAPMRVVFESTPGSAYARKKGIIESAGEILIFCDDDNWLSSLYVKDAFDYLDRNTEVLIACSKIIPVSNSELPNWFSEYQGWYACGVPQINPERPSELFTGWGAGMILKSRQIKQLFKYGIIHLVTGRKGKELVGGEDDEISFWIKQIGGKIGYCEDLVLHHFMPEERLTLEYRDRLINSISFSINDVRPKWWIIKKALEPFRKKDLIFIFLPNKRGRASRIKLGLYLKSDDLINNVNVLRKMIPS
jgi:glycosyltransferase involved in cell wall biosynthesis